jgi:hypothetical protein
VKRSDISDLMVCEATRVFSAGSGLRPMIDLYLLSRTSAPMKVIHAALERAYDRGLIECGVSLRTAWLTDKGKALLNTLTIPPPG